MPSDPPPIPGRPRTPPPALGDSPPALGDARPATFAAADASWRRLHPASLLFSIGTSVSRYLWPALLYLYVRQGDRYEGFLAILFVPSVLTAVIRYWSYRYRFGEGRLSIVEGVLQRNERHVPYARIQNIELRQGIVHRLLGVADVMIETASGREPEARMRVLSRRAVDELRARVFAERRATAAPASSAAAAATATAATPTPAAASAVSAEPAPEIALARIPLRELFLLGIISNRGMLVIGGAWALAWQFDLFNRLGGFVEAHLPDMASYERLSLAGQVAFALVVLLLILAAVRVLSIGWAVVTFYDFRLMRRGEELHASYGLLTRLSTAIPRRRVQLIQIQESLLHRLLGRASVRVETAGAAHDEESSHGREWLLPLVRRADLAALLAEVQPESDLAQFEWHPLDDDGRRRYRNRCLIVAALFGCAAAAVRWPWGATGFPILLAAALWYARLQLPHMAWGVTPRAVAWRRGWWTRRLSIVRFSKIQALQLERTPLDLRWDQALLRVDTAGAGRSGHPIYIPYLPVLSAEQLRDRWTTQAAAAAFQW